MRSSSAGVSETGTRSDSPVPRLSNTISRVNDARREKNDAMASCSHCSSTFDTKPGMNTRSVGPPPTNAGYNLVTLAKGVGETGEPMGLTVLPNRGVLHTSRDGTVRFTDVAGNTKIAGTNPVYSHDEEGLQSIKADPGFATKRWV